jgi:hypothetical protein
LYQRAYQQVFDEKLTDDKLNALAEEIRTEVDKAIGQDELPWTPDEMIEGFLEAVRKHRKELSSKWIEAMERDAVGVEQMSAVEADPLHVKITTPPAFLTAAHGKQLEQVAKKVNARLDSLSVEWLLEKFRALPPRSRKEFLKLADDVMDEKKLKVRVGGENDVLN